jgi:putative ABC transport system permease protein
LPRWITSLTAATAFWNISAFAYIKLHKNADIQNLLDKFPEFYEKYMSALGNLINASFTLRATRVDKIHYNPGLEFDLPVVTSATLSYSRW